MTESSGEKLNPEELLKSGNTVQLPPTGFSMYPFINPDRKDQVIIEPCDISRLKRGDVVLYRREGELGKLNSQNFYGGMLIIHRILRRSGDDFYIVGDNQTQIEGPVHADQICGKLTTIISDESHKIIYVTDAGYRIKSAIWLFLRPCRPAISHFIAGIKKALKIQH